MACNSIATTRATLGKVAISLPALQEVLASIAGIDASKIKISGSEYAAGDNYAAVTWAGVTWSLEQYKGEVTLQVQAVDQRLADKMLKDAQPKLSQALVIAQQKTVISRLAQLGKLSQVKGKDNGVTMRLEIDVN
jgi:hypothetical protein